MTAIGWFSEKPQHKLASISSQAQLPGRPSVRDSIAASLAGLSSSQDTNSENTTIRTMLDPEKETLSPPTTSQHPCLSFLLPQTATTPILSLSQARVQKAGAGLPLPQLTGTLSLPAQILGPSQLKGSCEWWVRGKSLWFSRVHYAQTCPSSAPCLGDKYWSPHSLLVIIQLLT